LVVWLGPDHMACGEPDPTAVKPMVIRTLCHLSVTCTCEIISLSESTDWRIHNQLRRQHTLPLQSRIVVSHRFTRWVVSMFGQYPPPFSWIQCAIWEEILCEPLLTQIAIYRRDINCIINYVHMPRAQGEIQHLRLTTSLAPCLILCRWPHHQNFPKPLLLVDT